MCASRTDAGVQPECFGFVSRTYANAFLSGYSLPPHLAPRNMPSVLFLAAGVRTCRYLSSRFVSRKECTQSVWRGCDNTPSRDFLRAAIWLRSRNHRHVYRFQNARQVILGFLRWDDFVSPLLCGVWFC